MPLPDTLQPYSTYLACRSARGSLGGRFEHADLTTVTPAQHAHSLNTTIRGRPFRIRAFCRLLACNWRTRWWRHLRATTTDLRRTSHPGPAALPTHHPTHLPTPPAAHPLPLRHQFGLPYLPGRVASHQVCARDGSDTHCRGTKVLDARIPAASRPTIPRLVYAFGWRAASVWRPH